MNRLSYTEAMKIDLPEGESNGVRVQKFEVSDSDAKLANMRAVFSTGGRGRIWPGTYTKLMRDNTLWMSDTPDEMHDHASAFWQAKGRGGRVLINGLGLGMVVQACLLLPNVEHVDVVEIDENVIKLVGPTYQERFGDRITIHHADAYEQRKKWPTGSRWNVAWHDIWPSISEDNLSGMATLKRSYGRRAAWQGAWAQEEILRMRQVSYW